MSRAPRALMARPAAWPVQSLPLFRQDLTPRLSELALAQCRGLQAAQLSLTPPVTQRLGSCPDLPLYSQGVLHGQSTPRRARLMYPHMDADCNAMHVHRPIISHKKRHRTSLSHLPPNRM